MKTDKYPFIICGDLRIAMIGKVGSTAISQAVVLKLHPNYNIRSGSGKDVSKHFTNPGIWQGSVDVDNGEVASAFVPIRDPLERFVSAIAQSGFSSVAEAFEHIERVRKTGRSDFHYEPVSSWVKRCESPIMVKFPNNLGLISDALGVPIPKVNEGAINNIPKIKLAKAEVRTVSAFYEEDIEIFKSL